MAGKLSVQLWVPMFAVISSIAENAKSRPFAPAVLNGERAMTYADLIGLIARVSNLFADRKLRYGAKLFLNIRDPDLRLAVSLAAIHAGMVPLILAEHGTLRPGIDYDLVVGARLPYESGLVADAVIDDAVLLGRLSDPVLREFPDRADEDFLYIGATSGTTGDRKLFVERWGSFREKSLGSHYLPVNQSDRVLSTIGDVTNYGFAFCLRTLFCRGAIVRHNPDTRRMLDEVNAFGVTQILSAPNQLAVMTGLMDTQGLRAPSVNAIMVGGGLLTQRLKDQASRVFNAQLYVAYGSSEVGGISAGRVDPATFEPGYVGEIRSGIEIISAGTPDGPGPIIVVNTRNRISEYWSNGKVLVSSAPSCRMPDLGYLKGKSLYLIGRGDEVLNLSGTKIAFAAIERALLEVPGVIEVGIVSAPPEIGPSSVIVGIVGTELDLERLGESASQALHNRELKAGLHFVRLAKIPRNQTGKVDRARLLGAYLKPPAISR